MATLYLNGFVTKPEFSHGGTKTMEEYNQMVFGLLGIVFKDAITVTYPDVHRPIRSQVYFTLQVECSQADHDANVGHNDRFLQHLYDENCMTRFPESITGKTHRIIQTTYVCESYSELLLRITNEELYQCGIIDEEDCKKLTGWRTPTYTLPEEKPIVEPIPMYCMRAVGTTNDYTVLIGYWYVYCTEDEFKKLEQLMAEKQQ